MVQERILNGKVIIRESTGTPGLDELQLSHDGTDAILESKSGVVNVVNGIRS